MPNMTPAEYAAYLRKTVPQEMQARGFPDDENSRETKLHESIMAYCRSQWPVWKFIHARTDKESTIAEGAQDFTIFLPGGKVVCGECKSATGKQTEKQRDWAFEMQRLGHTVHLWRDFESFLNTVSELMKP